MVKRWEPCKQYFDEWDEDGYYTCQPSSDGKYVLHSTYVNETARLRAQIVRMGQQISNLQNRLELKYHD